MVNIYVNYYLIFCATIVVNKEKYFSTGFVFYKPIFTFSLYFQIVLSALPFGNFQFQFAQFITLLKSFNALSDLCE